MMSSKLTKDKYNPMMSNEKDKYNPMISNEIHPAFLRDSEKKEIRKDLPGPDAQDLDLYRTGC